MTRCNALLALCGMMAASPALAQGSSVTLYGVLDSSIQYVDDIQGKSTTSLGSGTLGPERFGLRGVEDLGNGTKVQFRLEAGILSDRGRLVQPTRMFNREASLGLVTRAGTVTLGRLPDLVYEYITKFLSPPAATAIVSKHPGNWDNYASQYQYSSTVLRAE